LSIVIVLGFCICNLASVSVPVEATHGWGHIPIDGVRCDGVDEVVNCDSGCADPARTYDGEEVSCWNMEWIEEWDGSSWCGINIIAPPGYCDDDGVDAWAIQDLSDVEGMGQFLQCCGPQYCGYPLRLQRYCTNATTEIATTGDCHWSCATCVLPYSNFCTQCRDGSSPTPCFPDFDPDFGNCGVGTCYDGTTEANVLPIENCDCAEGCLICASCDNTASSSNLSPTTSGDCRIELDGTVHECPSSSIGAIIGAIIGVTCGGVVILVAAITIWRSEYPSNS